MQLDAVLQLCQTNVFAYNPFQLSIDIDGMELASSAHGHGHADG